MAAELLTPLQYCIDDGYLVSGSQLLPLWPFARKWTRQNHGPGCNNLVCGDCGRPVRSVARDVHRQEATALAAWQLMAVSGPQAGGAGLARLYACHCHQESRVSACPAPEPDANWGATTPWRCAGHPALVAPCEALGVPLGAGHWDDAVATLATDNSLERQGSIGTALGLVFAGLRGEDQEAFGHAMLAAVRHPDPAVRLGTVKAFALLDVAPQWPRRLAQLVLAEPQWTDLGRPPQPGQDDPDWWVARACTAIAPPDIGARDDQQRAVALIQKVALKPPGAGMLVQALADLDPQWTAEHIAELAAVEQRQAQSALYGLQGYPQWHAVALERMK
ncbi:MAG: hypothetical protein FJ100_06670 [Deltaproteobacteria bacterium]|nr:hypothetical protein [Deltaproteobacteria bacterium]